MISDRELEVLINEIYDYYGFDFSGYSMASFKRRAERLLQIEGLNDVSGLLSKIRTEAGYADRLLEEITVNVTEMFRDPLFYKTLRNEILPVIATKPFIRIWIAGCSTGEEAYSVAILLKEANLLHKSLLYATDINPDVLAKAKDGTFSLRIMRQYSENYIRSGGKSDFSGYYIANYGVAKFDPSLSEKMVFSQHNLVSDRSFNEFDLVLCRNVMIYFDKPLQDRVLQLFDESLDVLGYLALGTKETIKFSSVQDNYRQFQKEKIWQKVK